MLKICIYDDGRITKEEVDRSEALGFMHNNSVGGLFYTSHSNPKNNHEAIFLDGDKKAYHLKSYFNKKKKEIDVQMRKLKKEKKSMDEMLKSVIEGI